jgi:hypothetical protein
MPDHYWVLKIHTQLISVSKLVCDGFRCTITRNGCHVADATGRGIVSVVPVAVIYLLHMQAIPVKVAAVAIQLPEVLEDELAARVTEGVAVIVITTGATMEVWHCHQGV